MFKRTTFVSLELVHDPARPVTDISAVNHLVVQVDHLDATIADLATKGVTAEPPSDPGPGLRTSWLTDPDGYRIELVQWPAGHPAGMTSPISVADCGRSVVRTTRGVHRPGVASRRGRDAR